MTARRGLVRLDGHRVGSLVEAGGRVSFTYDADYAQQPGARPVSLALPVRTEPYVSPTLHPFFANLLPEGWLLEISISKLKIARDDAFGLLLATCADCVGAVEVVVAQEEAP